MPRGKRSLSLRARLLLAAAVPAWLAVNWLVQAARKPAELVGLFEGSFFKDRRKTWESYGDDFRKHATAIMTPEFLAALAQAETGGNPIARTYWSWRWSSDPFRVFTPASSSVGLYQMTDGTFAECRRFCIHRGKSVAAGRWHELRACWFNGLYNRLIPGHAIEMSSACLDRKTSAVLEKAGAGDAPAHLKRDLAAVIQLCGPGAGEAFARKRFRFSRGQRCGDHDPADYLRRVRALEKSFAKLAKD